MALAGLRRVGEDTALTGENEGGVVAPKAEGGAEGVGGGAGEARAGDEGEIEAGMEGVHGGGELAVAQGAEAEEGFEGGGRAEAVAGDGFGAAQRGNVGAKIKEVWALISHLLHSTGAEPR